MGKGCRQGFPATPTAAADVFYFGDLVADSDDGAVDTDDELAVRMSRRGPRNPAAIDNAYDYNRDRLVGAVDRILARHQLGAGLSGLGAALDAAAPQVAATLPGPLQRTSLARSASEGGIKKHLLPQPSLALRAGVPSAPVAGTLRVPSAQGEGEKGGRGERAIVGQTERTDVHRALSFMPRDSNSTQSQDSQRPTRWRRSAYIDAVLAGI